VVVSTKAGMRRRTADSTGWERGSVDPEALRTSAVASHAALGGVPRP